MNKSIVCGKDNVKEFTNTLKTEFPDFYLVIKSLYQNGMIEGLRGAEIIPLNNDPEKTKPSLLVENKTRCCQCAYWYRDLIGDGTGVGKCELNMNPKKLKYPNTRSCEIFEANNE